MLKNFVLLTEVFVQLQNGRYISTSNEDGNQYFFFLRLCFAYINKLNKCRMVRIGDVTAVSGDERNLKKVKKKNAAPRNLFFFLCSRDDIKKITPAHKVKANEFLQTDSPGKKRNG